MILAGDVGGTKCNLALFEARMGTLRRVAQRRFESRKYTHFEEVVTQFIEGLTPGSEGGGAKITAAGFGVAGPVIEDHVRATKSFVCLLTGSKCIPNCISKLLR